MGIKKSFTLLYGAVSYIIFLATITYLIGFTGNFIVPKAIDSAVQAPLTEALLINVLLIIIFALQHSIMARPAFKKWLAKFMSKAVERSTFVLFSSLALIGLIYFWQPLGGVVWKIQNNVLVSILWLGFAFGWVLVFLSTFLINHFDLFGLRQVWLYFRGREYSHLQYKTPSLYNVVRHPLYLGFLLAFWCTPYMTATHLLFAVIFTVYIFVGIRLEEKDSVEVLGEEYRSYLNRVPMIFPKVHIKR